MDQNQIENLNESQLANLPPQDIPLERAVLGTFLLESKSFSTVATRVNRDTFYDNTNKVIYEAMRQLFDEDMQIDIMTVQHRLNQMRANVKPDYLVDLLDNINSASHLETHVAILVELSIKRYMIEVMQNAIHTAHDKESDAFDILNNVSDASAKIHAFIGRGGAKTASKVYREFIDDVEVAMSSKGHITGIPSPFKRINDVTGGWQDSDLIIKAGRPGMGKTADMISEVLFMVTELKIPVLIFSLEMSAKQLMSRIISATAKVNSQKMKTGKISQARLNQIVNATSHYMQSEMDRLLHIIDEPGMAMSEIRATAKMYHQKFGIRKVYVDYLQLATEKANSREQEVAKIARGLKNLAKELDVPVTAYAQLSRKVEERGDKKPRLSDLRESGEIEQAADIVIMYYRPEYYGIKQMDDGTSSKGLAILMFEKFRAGYQNDIVLGFIGAFTMFCNASEVEELLKLADSDLPDFIQSDMFDEPF